jgi:DNA processing protein
MTPFLSPNTKAILLLTAPLIAGRAAPVPDLLSPGEYKRLARHLRELQRQPADLVEPNASELMRQCQPIVETERLARLLGRGFLLSQVIERWQTRAIWVVSRADPNYPRRLKSRLREDAPAVLYGCGEVSLLETGGLAVVGSRHVDDSLIEYTMSVGRLAARGGRTLVSGGAKGIDQAAMRGALEAGGKVSGVLADSLEKTSMNREHRDLLIEGQLVLISPYDPSAGFNVGNAMQRNKLIYALADASLVVSADLNKGGTWTGASEQLDKLRFIPVYVRSTGDSSPGLEGLRLKGAMPWPEPEDSDALQAIFDEKSEAAHRTPQGEPALFDEAPPGPAELTSVATVGALEETVTAADGSAPTLSQEAPSGAGNLLETSTRETILQSAETESADLSTSPHSPAEALFDAVRESMRRLLTKPMKDAEIATALDVSPAQAKAWLNRLLDEGTLEKKNKPAGYVVKRSLFE